MLSFENSFNKDSILLSPWWTEFISSWYLLLSESRAIRTGKVYVPSKMSFPAGFPRVSGQQEGYLISTLKEYRNLSRDAGDYSLVMQSASQNLKDSDIEALANYMHGLYQQWKKT